MLDDTARPLVAQPKRLLDEFAVAVVVHELFVVVEQRFVAVADVDVDVGVGVGVGVCVEPAEQMQQPLALDMEHI